MGIPVALIAVMLAVGSFLPSEHVAASRAVLDAPPDSVWSVVRDFVHMAAWRPELKAVNALPPRDGRSRWVEVAATGELPYELVSEDAPRRLVTRMAETGLPFDETRTYLLRPAGGGTSVTLVERARIRNALYRFTARFLFGYHSALDGYLRSLGARFGEAAVPEHVPPPGEAAPEAGPAPASPGAGGSE